MDIFKTDGDIIRWAEKVAEAKGEKYTHLTKHDQFLLAGFVLNSSGVTRAMPFTPSECEPVAVGVASESDGQVPPPALGDAEAVGAVTPRSLSSATVSDDACEGDSTDASTATGPTSTDGYATEIGGEPAMRAGEYDMGKTEDNGHGGSPTANPYPHGTKPRTNAELLHSEGATAQEAFDRFLNSRSSGKFVMDFSTGRASVAASFAYWLLGTEGGDEPNGL